MCGDVVNTRRAAEILGVSRPRIIQMISNRTIKSAYMASPDGFQGRSGYRISVQELYELRDAREKKNQKDEVIENVIEEPTDDREAIKNALGELQACLSMLAETIGKLKEGL